MDAAVILEELRALRAEVRELIKEHKADVQREIEDKTKTKWWQVAFLVASTSGSATAATQWENILKLLGIG